MISNDITLWSAAAVGAWKAMTPDLRADLATWEATNVPAGRATFEWPGWAHLDLAYAPPEHQPYIKAAVPGPLRQQVYARDGHRCVSCGAPERLTCDHIEPEVHGGPTTFDNLQTLCGPCNSKKGTRI